jgi:hypothetical protein
MQLHGRSLDSLSRGVNFYNLCRLWMDFVLLAPPVESRLFLCHVLTDVRGNEDETGHSLRCLLLHFSPLQNPHFLNV